MKRVIVGMSGGVDSSVAALLLKKQGYEVIGITMDIWQNKKKDHCSLDVVKDSKKVASQLNIPHHVLDLKNDFKKEVVDEFVKEYKNARTPNPCILCNKAIKFEKLLEKAKTIFNADYIATGHYAKVDYNETTGRYFLREAASSLKDQTYALYSLTQDQLAHVLFPLGEYTKEQVRKIAEEYELVNSNKQDSQEICFIEDNDYAKFIINEYKYKPIPGDFINKSGKILGKHKGIINYTIGQRRGLGLSLKKPMYVYKIEKEKNNVVLAYEEDLYSDILECNNVVFAPFKKLERPMQVTAKIRYLAKKAKATIYPLENGNIKVVFDNKERAITPGQAVVFYDVDIVIGGGTII